jgi:hypothetical protein
VYDTSVKINCVKEDISISIQVPTSSVMFVLGRKVCSGGSFLDKKCTRQEYCVNQGSI